MTVALDKMNKDQIRRMWEKTVTLCVYKRAEGGIGWDALKYLKWAGIPARKGHCPYVGQVGIEVPKRFEKRAKKVIW